MSKVLPCWKSFFPRHGYTDPALSFFVFQILHRKGFTGRRTKKERSQKIIIIYFAFFSLLVSYLVNFSRCCVFCLIFQPSSYDFSNSAGGPNIFAKAASKKIIKIIKFGKIFQNLVKFEYLFFERKFDHEYLCSLLFKSFFSLDLFSKFLIQMFWLVICVKNVCVYIHVSKKSKSWKKISRTEP